MLQSMNSIEPLFVILNKTWGSCLREVMEFNDLGSLITSFPSNTISSSWIHKKVSSLSKSTVIDPVKMNFELDSPFKCIGWGIIKLVNQNSEFGIRMV